MAPIEGKVERVVPDEGECLGIGMTTGAGKLSVAFPEKGGILCSWYRIPLVAEIR